MKQSKSTNSIISRKKNELYSTSSQINLKTIKFAEIYKEIYSNNTGEAIKFLKYQKVALKSNHDEKKYHKD